MEGKAKERTEKKVAGSRQRGIEELCLSKDC